MDELVAMKNDNERRVTEQQKVIKELELRLKAVERERDGNSKKLFSEKKQNSDLLKRCKRLEAESYSVSSDLKEFQKEQRENRINEEFAYSTQSSIGGRGEIQNSLGQTSGSE